MAGAALSAVYGYTDDMIRRNQRLATEKAIKAVVPGSKKFKKERLGKENIYKGIGADGALRGYAFISEFPGFQGKIRVMIGMDPELEKITGLEVLDNDETPGLGNRIVNSSWRSGFEGIRGDNKITLVKNKTADKSKNEVEAITGATISSRAVIQGVDKKVKAVRKATGR